MYGERIRDLHDLLSTRCWWLIYQADMRMRSEKFDRIRRRLESTHQQMLEAGASEEQANKTYNKDHPWDIVMRAASNDESATFWSNEVVTKAQLYLTSVKSDSALKDEGMIGHVQRDGLKRDPTEDGQASGSVKRQKKALRGDDGNLSPTDRDQFCAQSTTHPMDVASLVEISSMRDLLEDGSHRHAVLGEQ
eukprot:1777123-Amphidinium_carterae.1